MNTTENITVVVATDNHYAVLLGALIKSIEVNHKTSEKIDLYIIDDEIATSSKKKIQQSASPEITTLHWVKKQDAIQPNFKIPVDKSAFPITTYLRLFAPYIIPQTAKRFIYLDVDMILMDDISKLWNIDLQGKLAGAVPDIAKVVSSDWGGIPNYKELGFLPDDPYFNAGMLVADPIRWREEDMSNKVIQAIFDNMKSVNYPDQYGLNVALHGNWLVLDQRWNAFSALEIPDPFLIHFLDIKPIFKSYRGNNTYRDEFYRYLQLTPWKGFSPISDYRRLARKAYIKLKKNVFGRI